MPTPYSPAKWVDTKIIAARKSTGATTDCMPTASPVIITVAEPVSPDFDPNRLWSAWTTLRSLRMASELGVLYDNPDHRKQLKPEIVFEVEQGRALELAQVQEASLVRSNWFACLAELYKTFDALVLPSAQVFPFDAETQWPERVHNRNMSTYHQWMEIVVPASIAGLPTINVPVGFGASGLPMGMQIIGKRGNDAQILRLGHAYHEATDWPAKRPPKL